MGSCNCNRPFRRNYQTTININYGPIYSKTDYNNLSNNNKLEDKFKPNSYIYEKADMLPTFNNQNNLINNNMNSNYNPNIKSDLNYLQNIFENMKAKYNIFNKNIIEQEKYISDDKLYIKKIFNKNTNNEDIFGNFFSNNYNYANEELLINIENISDEIDKYNNLIENQKNEMKNLENNFQIIENQFNDIQINQQTYPTLQDFFLFININNINQQLNQSESIIKKIEYNQNLFVVNKIGIEKNLKKLQYIYKKNKFLENNQYNNCNLYINDSLFAKSTMLLGIKDFNIAKESLQNLFNDEIDEDIVYPGQNILTKYFQETCYINDEYDLYDITYELKAIGLSENMIITYNTFKFDECEGHIEIILFEVDGIISSYEYGNNYLKFNLNLRNLESNNIHIRYKETPIYKNMTQGEEELRKIYRSKKYGLSELLFGQTAKFILINESNFEIINFEEEFFIKIKKNEYQWGGIVPEGGKKTMIRMSKKEARVNFFERHIIKSTDNTFIKDTETKIPLCYIDGNNQIIKIKYESKQTKKIKIDKNKKVFEVKYFHIKSYIGEFIVKGALKNICKGEWKIKLSDEEIDSLIPPDFKTNIEEFRRISNEIITNYDEEHKDDLIVVPNITKIGKWIKKNITYDLAYKGLKNLTATQVYKLRRGVCHHFTNLFNALLYSLGYQALYVLGYVVDKKTTFSIEDTHAWSLVKFAGKWLPFDATWGIFSGNLPVTYIFKQIGAKEIETMSADNIKIEPIFVEGNIDLIN